MKNSEKPLLHEVILSKMEEPDVCASLDVMYTLANILRKGKLPKEAVIQVVKRLEQLTARQGVFVPIKRLLESAAEHILSSVAEDEAPTPLAEVSVGVALPGSPDFQGGVDHQDPPWLWEAEVSPDD